MKSTFLFLSLFINLISFAQEEVTFGVRFQNYIQGDITFISNNIVNRNTGNNANEAYNKQNSSAKLNDQFEMQYIDIDNDNSTFSSSSATFNLASNSKEVIFAGLYWSANYKSEIGINKTEENAFENTERAENFNEIKIKTPTSNTYQNIRGQIIFDGYKHGKYKNISPYVCFYDLTSTVQKNPYGEYTVANIKATQGFIEGGVSGGWILYFVYKDEAIQPKYITLYDGFAHVYNKPVGINLSNFLTPKSGAINCKLTMSALEGDYTIDGDNVRLKNMKTNRYFPLTSKIRNGNNFFNSQITIEDNHFLERKPASLNTLGFDALLLTLNNKNNQIIDNNTTEAEIKISSMGDKVYLFSTGFSIDVDADFFIEKSKTNNSISNTKPIEIKPIVAEKTIKSNKADVTPTSIETAEKEKKLKVKSINIKVTEIPSVTSEDNEAEISEIKNKEVQVFEKSNQTSFALSAEKKESRKEKEIRTISVKTNLKHGYYLIANVFAYEHNADNYAFFLKQHNIRTGYFTNPENNYRYVFLKYYEKKQDIIEAYNSNYNNTFFDDYWILEIDK